MSSINELFPKTVPLEEIKRKEVPTSDFEEWSTMTPSDQAEIHLAIANSYDEEIAVKILSLELMTGFLYTIGLSSGQSIRRYDAINQILERPESKTDDSLDFVLYPHILTDSNGESTSRFFILKDPEVDEDEFWVKFNAILEKTNACLEQDFQLPILLHSTNTGIPYKDSRTFKEPITDTVPYVISR